MVSRHVRHGFAALAFGLAALIGGGTISTASGQDTAAADSAGAGVIRIELESAAFGESRPALIRLPAGYEESGDERYPVLYVLNEEDNFHWASQIAAALAGRQIHDLIVVGLPSAETYGRDNYPFAGGTTREANEWAARYETFIRDEAAPYIEANYRTSGRFIAGHSLSGLFVTNLFLHQPEGFNVHIVISPSYHQAPQIIDMMGEGLDGGGVASGALYLTIGAMEHSQIQEQYARMRDLLAASAPEALVWRADSIPNTEHQAAAFGGLFASLTWIYRGLYSQEVMATDLGLEGTIAHYNAVSGLVGYEVTPVENNMIGLAVFMLSRKDNPPAALTAYRIAHHYFPDNVEARGAVAILEPWIEGGAPALRAALEAGAELDEAAADDVARSLMAAGRPTDAAALLEIAAEQHPDSTSIAETLAAAREAAGSR